MTHPSPQERLDLLAPSMRNETQISALIDMEKTQSIGSLQKCGCGRKACRTLYCSWCWREMLALVLNWQ